MFHFSVDKLHLSMDTRLFENEHIKNDWRRKAGLSWLSRRAGLPKNIARALRIDRARHDEQMIGQPIDIG